MSKRIQTGVSLIEVMITIVIFAFLLGLAAPTLAQWAQNRQIRTAAESIQNGLMLARAEAVRRNANIRFNLVSTMKNDCALSSSGPNWVISADDPSGQCDAAASDTIAPRIIQIRTNAEGSPNAAISGNGVTTINFNGMGLATSGAATIDVTNPTGGACRRLDAGNIVGVMTCLRVVVSPGGQVRMCDPFANLPADDPRRC